MKKLFLIIYCTFISFSLNSKHIIFDLGDVLVRQSRFTFAQNIGFSQFISYALLDFQNPKYIKDIAFDILDHLYLQETDENLYATHENRPLPGPMCSWLAGTLSPEKLIEQIINKIDELEKNSYFISLREKKLVTDILTNMFAPQSLIDCTSIIPQALKLIRKLSNYKEHQLYILSNWDPTSFELLKKRPDIQNLFKFFKKENIFISGNHGIIKPYKAIYEIFLNTYKLNPKECIFIDDQKNNILGAQAFGITGIHFLGNYKQLMQELKALL